MFLRIRAHLEFITVFPIHTLILALALLSAVRVPAARASTPPNTIRLQGFTIDTSAGTDLRAQAPALAGSSGRYVIQLNGPMTHKRRSRLQDAGAVLEGYLPINAFIVRLDQADAGKLAELGFIRWTGPFQDAWKLNPFLGQLMVRSPERIALDQQGLIQIMIVLFPGENAEAIAADLAVRGAILWKSFFFWPDRTREPCLRKSRGLGQSRQSPRGYSQPTDSVGEPYGLLAMQSSRP